PGVKLVFYGLPFPHEKCLLLRSRWQPSGDLLRVDADGCGQGLSPRPPRLVEFDGAIGPGVGYCVVLRTVSCPRQFGGGVVQGTVVSWGGEHSYTAKETP